MTATKRSYQVVFELDGIATVTVEAESEEEAVRRGRHLVDCRECEEIVEYECVRVTPKGEA